MTERTANSGELQVVPDAAALNAAAAKEIVACGRSAIQTHGQFSIALSGGNTPRNIYSWLAEQDKEALPWNKVHIFFGDERHVPPDHPDSNYRMAQESLLSKVPIPPGNVHRIFAELPEQLAADKYERELKLFFRLSAGEWPRFDLVLLGIGDEGHTASLFPGSAALEETSRLVAANWVEKLQTWRITFTYPVLNHAAEVLFLVSGLSKAGILRDIFDPAKANSFPAQGVHPVNGRLLWLADRSAASLL